MFVAAGAKWNAKTGYYELYPEKGGLTDITEEEMRLIYNAYSGSIKSNYSSIFANTSIRTNYKLNRNISTQLLNESFMSSKIQVACLNTLPGKVTNCFRECRLLERIVGDIDLRYCKTVDSVRDAFKGCTALQSAVIVNLSVDLSLRDSPLLSIASVLAIIKRCLAISNITITLHPQAFARASADTEIQTLLAEKTHISLTQA